MTKRKTTRKQAKPAPSLMPSFSLPALSTLTNSKPKLAAVIIGAVVLLLLAFPLRFLIVPAVVNGQPIFSWQYVLALHKKAGPQILNQLISDKLVEQEIAKNQIQVPQTEIDSQIAQIESNIGTESGGLEALLAYQGMTRDEFIKQLRLNLALEKLVKGQIAVSDADVAKELAENSKNYLNLSDIDAATTAAENIRQSKLQQTFSTWFQEIQAKAKIYNFFSPAPAPNP